ncbi:hypothetical protein J6Z19_01690 [bacterium]|nr:hypothetical protein [bacterium]
MKLITVILLLSVTIDFSPFRLCAEPTPLEQLAAFLRGEDFTSESLENDYSCITLDEMLEKALKNIADLEKAVVSARKNTRVAGLLPEISFWGKYKSDEKLYLYQRNNIAVGKDYITVGPDDNNTTYGDLNSYEVGGKISFDLKKLLYNADTIKFGEQEHKLYMARIEMIDRLSGIYYFSAMMNAVEKNGIKIPPEQLLVFKIIDRKNNGWLKSYAGFDLYSCGGKR